MGKVLTEWKRYRRRRSICTAYIVRSATPSSLLCDGVQNTALRGVALSLGCDAPHQIENDLSRSPSQALAGSGSRLRARQSHRTERPPPEPLPAHAGAHRLRQRRLCSSSVKDKNVARMRRAAPDETRRFTMAGRGVISGYRVPLVLFP